MFCHQPTRIADPKMTESDVLPAVRRRICALNEYRKFLFLAFGLAGGAAIALGAGAPAAGGVPATLALLAYLARYQIGLFVDGFERDLAYLRSGDTIRAQTLLSTLSEKTHWPLWQILKP